MPRAVRWLSPPSDKAVTGLYVVYALSREITTVYRISRESTSKPSKGKHYCLHVDGVTWLTDDILVKVDRTTMRNGLEARAPYLDRHLAEYVATINDPRPL